MQFAHNDTADGNYSGLWSCGRNVPVVLVGTFKFEEY